MNDWRADKKWSDRFLKEIKAILGVHLIGEPPKEEDAERNTDLMVLGMGAVRIGCRIRQAKFASLYHDEFTIRSSRPSGAKTELQKLAEGWGDYFFYGFSDHQGRKLSRWTLADMRVFRRHFEAVSFLSKSNLDRSSGFAAFKWLDFPDDFIVGQSAPIGSMRTARGRRNFWRWYFLNKETKC